ncbi:MAG: hypothetical protein RL385_2199, partial [Pseudomonadota bacterium]
MQAGLFTRLHALMLGSAFSLVSACGASVPQSATLPEAPSAE